MLASLVDYARCFTHALRTPEQRRLLAAHRRALAAPPALTEAALLSALSTAADWLCRAQDHSGDGGLGSHHLLHGWGRTYPETTGYAIPTLLALADRLHRPDLEQRAVRAAETLLALQRADGGWQGGRVGEARESVVFNTAQVVRGMLAMHHRCGEARYLDAAVRAGNWIVATQEPDGSWSRSNFMGRARVYDTYVDAPLLLLHQVTGNAALRAVAGRNLSWVAARQQANGWFADADNTVKHNDRPIIHTIAYTIDGLVECGELLGDGRWIDHGHAAGQVLRDRFLQQGRLNGRYNGHWKGSEHFIPTGGAQLAIAWERLARHREAMAYREAAARMRAVLVEVQRRSLEGPADVHGALPGSFPLWGRYEKFAFPNWGVKYFADALLWAGGKAPH
jgi:hypothetical protein